MKKKLLKICQKTLVSGENPDCDKGSLTFRQRYSVSDGIEPVADLGQFTVALHLVLHGGGLGEVGVVPLQHALLPLIRVFHKHRRLLVLHERKHSLIDWKDRILQANDQIVKLSRPFFH